jgi:hypothetical protein
MRRNVIVPVLVVVLVGLVAAGRGDPNPPVQAATLAALAEHPKVVASPDTVAPSALTDHLLVDTTLPVGMVPAEANGGLAYYTIPVGTDSPWDPSQAGATCCTGLRLDYVLSGRYRVQSDASLQLQHAGTARWEPVAAGTELTLGPGDALLLPLGAGFAAANTGSTPVMLLEGVFGGAGEVTTDPIPSGWSVPSPSSQEVIINPRSVPAVPLQLRLRQATLAPQAYVEVPAGAIAQLAVTADEGAMVAIQPNPDETRVTEIAAQYVKHNVGPEPVHIYVLTLVPTADDATTGAATPAT